MRASRARAWSSDSRITRPAPSPHTKPSRFASNGRMALVGSSLRVDIAFMEQKPAIVSGMTMASDPPAIITSASPRWMILKESPIAWLPVAHAVTTEEFGPLAPKRIDTRPDAMFTMSIGMKKGETRSGPFSRRFRCDSRRVGMPPMPGPIRKPNERGCDQNAEPRAVDLAGVQRRVLDRQDRGRHRVLQIGIEASRILLVDEVQRIEVPYLTGDAGRGAFGIELRDRPDARSPLHERGPELLG